MDGLTKPLFLGRLRPSEMLTSHQMVALCLEVQAAHLFLTVQNLTLNAFNVYHVQNTEVILLAMSYIHLRRPVGKPTM